MNFQLIEIKEFSGKMAKIYSIKLDGDENTLLEQFFEEYEEKYESEIISIAEKINTIGHETECNWNYFTHYEGNSGDGVSVLKKGRLRLYCIYFNDTVVCFGTGGYKPENIRAYQEDKELDAKVNIIKSVAKQINKDISKGNLRVRQNGELDYIN